MISYASLGGVALMWYNTSSWVGLSFGVSSVFAIVLIQQWLRWKMPAMMERTGKTPPPEREWEG